MLSNSALSLPSSGSNGTRIAGIPVSDSAPIRVVYGTADGAAFPSHAHKMFGSIAHDRAEIVEIKDADHYFQGRPDLAKRMSEIIVDWGRY